MPIYTHICTTYEDIRMQMQLRYLSKTGRCACNIGCHLTHHTLSCLLSQTHFRCFSMYTSVQIPPPVRTGTMGCTYTETKQPTSRAGRLLNTALLKCVYWQWCNEQACA